MSIALLPPSDKFWYVASPFSDSDIAVRQHRLRMSQDYLARLCEERVLVYGAIHGTSYCDGRIEAPYEHDFWIRYNKAFIDPSAGVLVCDMQGWQKSRGVDQEIQYAHSIGLPVYLLSAHMQIKLIIPEMWESIKLGATYINKSTPKPV